VTISVAVGGDVARGAQGELPARSLTRAGNDEGAVSKFLSPNKRVSLNRLGVPCDRVSRRTLRLEGREGGQAPDAEVPLELMTTDV